MSFPVCQSRFVSLEKLGVANGLRTSSAKSVCRFIDYPFSVGTNPSQLAFDGTNIWVTNEGSSDVTKLKASTGGVLGTFSVGSVPSGIAAVSRRYGLILRERRLFPVSHL